MIQRHAKQSYEMSALQDNNIIDKIKKNHQAIHIQIQNQKNNKKSNGQIAVCL